MASTRDGPKGPAVFERTAPPGAVIAAWVYQYRRGDAPLVVERQRAAFRIPGFRVLALAWVGALVIGTILLILASDAGF